MNELTSQENRSVVTSVAFFVVRSDWHISTVKHNTDQFAQAGVAFLHSSWNELLLPPWVPSDHRTGIDQANLEL